MSVLITRNGFSFSLIPQQQLKLLTFDVFFFGHCPSFANGTPLLCMAPSFPWSFPLAAPYSGLENVMDRRAWWATVSESDTTEGLTL